jgi:uncharacterized membrane protein YdbT with pleckstrin-like domain
MTNPNVPAPDARRAAAPPKEPERDLWQSRYAARAALHLWLGAAAFWFVAVYVAFAYLSAGTPRTVVLVLSFVPLALAVWTVLLTKLSTHYRLTNQRLFVTEGVLSRTISEVELVRVDDVAVRQTLFQRVCGVGDVLLTTTDKHGSEVAIVGIDAPVVVKELIRENVQRLRAGVFRMESV